MIPERVYTLYKKVLLTDITYIINGKAPRCCMCTFIDACTKELLAWTLSTSLEEDFVLEAANDMIKSHGVSLAEDALIHSDQGSHYKSVKFVRLIKDSELRQTFPGVQLLTKSDASSPTGLIITITTDTSGIWQD